MQGLEQLIKTNPIQRKEMLSYFSEIVSAVECPRHKNIEMSKIYKMLQECTRKEFELNHRQYDDMYKFVKDNKELDINDLEHKYRRMYIK